MEQQSIPQKSNRVTTHLDRFIATTGKTEKEYLEWASEVGRKMHINTLDKLVCAKLNIYSAAHLIHVPTPLPLGISENEVSEYLIQNSQNPYELGKLWSETKADALAWTCKESTIANSLAFFPKSDFEQFGDKNHLADVSRTWFKKDGLNLDTQAQEMSENSGFEITVQDLVEFVMKYRPRTYKNPAEVKLKQIEERFREVTGFGIKEYYVEHLLKICYVLKPQLEEVPF